VKGLSKAFKEAFKMPFTGLLKAFERHLKSL
jgi:hypothetical protein